jgi:hypothetical protein
LLQHLLSVLWRYLDRHNLVPAPGKTPEQYRNFRITTKHLAAALNFPSTEAMDEFVRSGDKAHPREKLNEAWLLKRALDQAAESVMPSASRTAAIAERMFRLLAEIDDRGNYKRRWTSRREILDVSADLKATEAEVDKIIAAFSEPYPFLNARAGMQGKIDVSHEAFIRNWTQFVGWLKNERHLAVTYDLLRNKYLQYRRQCAEEIQQGNIWGRIRLAFSRLNKEQLVELSDWKRSRSENVAWAGRYANGVQGEDPDFRPTGPINVQTEEFNKKLLTYFKRSKLLSYSAPALSAVAALTLMVLVLLLLDQVQLNVTKNRDYVSQAALGISGRAIDKSPNIDGHDVNDRLQVMTDSNALVLYAHRPKEGPLGMMLAWYRTLLDRPDDPGYQYYYTRRQIDILTRQTLDSAMFPMIEKYEPRQLLAKSQITLSSSCNSELAKADPLKNILQGNDSLADLKNAYVTLAPLEREGGKQIVLAPTENGSLILLLISEKENACRIRYLASFGLPPGELLVDRSLKLVIVNMKSDKSENRAAYVYRISWSPSCNPEMEDKDCAVPISVDFFGPTVLTGANYRILDENHIESIEDNNAKSKQGFELASHHRPVLLGDTEARRINFPERPCALSGRYAAFIREENAKTRRFGGPAKTLYVIEHANRVTDCNWNGDIAAEAIVAIPISDYSITSAAFPEQYKGDSEPEFVYLQGLSGSPNTTAVYKLALVPKQMYCLSESKTNDAPSDQFDALLRSQNLTDVNLHKLSTDLVGVPTCANTFRETH